MISTNAQIASVVRYANALYGRIDDETARNEFADLWIGLERKVDSAQAAGDLMAVQRHIDEWRVLVSARFEELSR